MNKAVLLITTGLLLLVFFIFYSGGYKNSLPVEEVELVDKWELPNILKEVSGIAYLGKNLMACIQDEDGTIFIYDLKKRQIVREIEFAGAGDYESITLAGETLYVLRSDGTIYEVKNYHSGKPQIKEINTPEIAGKNFEGLEYDKKNNRLLLSIKERSGKEYRPVFSFDLGNGQLEEAPVFKIPFSDPIFSDLGKKPSEKFFRPSEISIHPQSGKIYMLEGIVPKILILNMDGTPEKLHLLSLKQFAQAEGLTFGEKGEIYISNEGARGNPPNILQISLN